MGGEFFFAERPDIYFDGAVVVDEGERWLVKDVESAPDGSLSVDEVIELGDAGFVDEVSH